MPFDPTTTELEVLRPSVSDGYKRNYQMWDGDHWQEGEGWESVLPDPQSTSHEKYEREKQRIEDAFTSKNVIREVVERHLGGVIGQPPSVQYNREADEDEADEEEADEVAASMFGVGRFIKLLRKAGRHPLLGEPGYIRVYPNERAFDPETQEVRTDLSFESALDLLDVKACKPTYTYCTRVNGYKVAAYWRTWDSDKRVVEVSYFDENGDTIITLIEAERSDGGDWERTINVSDPIDLGGHLHVHEVTRGSLITEQVRQQQHTVNKAATMADTNLDYGGFLERIFLNAQRPVKRVENAQGQDEFVDAPYQAGAGQTAFITGVVTEDNEGNQKVATPKVKFREPIPVNTFDDTKQMAYEDILGEVDQRHVLMSGDATASAFSRIAAREEFVGSLRPTRRALSQAGDWIGQVTPRFADDLAGASRMDNVRVNVQLHLDRGVRTPQEIKTLSSLVEKEQLSLQTMLDLVGVTDSARELERISAQQADTISRKADRAEVLSTLVSAGASIQTAAIVAGFDEDEARLLMSVPVPAQEQ